MLRHSVERHVNEAGDLCKKMGYYDIHDVVHTARLDDVSEYDYVSLLSLSLFLFLVFPCFT